MFTSHPRPTVCGGIDAMETQFFNKCHTFDVKTGEWHEFNHTLLEPRWEKMKTFTNTTDNGSRVA